MKGFRESTEDNKKSSLRAGIIRSDIERVNSQILRDAARFQVNELTSPVTEVTLEALNRLEREFRENLSDPHSQFITHTLTCEDGSKEMIEVLDWLTQMKVRVK